MLKRLAGFLPGRRYGRKVTLSRSKAGTLAIAFFLCLVSLFMVLPVVYSLIQSLKPLEEIFAYPPRFFVRRPTLMNFKMLFRLADNLEIPFSRYFFNTVSVSLVGTVVYVFLSSMAAFSMAKGNFKGKKFLFSLVVFAIMFEGDVLQMPRYLIVSTLGMVDTYWALVVPFLGGTLGVFLMRQFILAAIPDSTLEAARIDGAGEFTIFFKIVMPSIKAAWLTVSIFAFQGFYRSGGIEYIYSENLKQLDAVLASISAGGIGRAGAASAAGVIAIVLPVLVFLFTQSSINETMAHSGLK